MAGSAIEVRHNKKARNLFVCIKNGCDKCSMECKEIPKDCPYKILHALEKNDGGIRAMPRQSGKTTMLVEMANDVAKKGYHTYMVTINQQMCERLHRIYGLDSTIKVASEHQADRFFRGMAPGYVLFDDIMPDTVKHIMRTMIGSVLVASYFTPR